MAVAKPVLPFAHDALAPHISEETLNFHFGKHHLGYFNKLGAATEGTEFASWGLEDFITKPEGKPFFNNAAQIWNHSFYWNCLSPNGGGEPTGALADAINAKWGSFAAFKDAFTKAAGHFGSGWAWLVKDADGNLAITDTSDADTPLAHGQTALMTIDVWEHAYYIDFRNDRASYISAYWNLVNWDFIASNL